MCCSGGHELTMYIFSLFGGLVDLFWFYGGFCGDYFFVRSSDFSEFPLCFVKVKQTFLPEPGSFQSLPQNV